MNGLKHRFRNIAISMSDASSILRAVLLTIFVMSPVSVMAKDVFTINQKDHKFSEMFVKVKNNDVIRFVNLDSVNHRLVFMHKGQQEQMNDIKPGKSQEVSFSQPGIYDVVCKIHPEMKLTIFIPYVANLSKTKAFYTF